LLASKFKETRDAGRAGADEAGWRAACSFGIPTGGWMPIGFLTEDHDGKRPEPHPEFVEPDGGEADHQLPRTDPGQRPRLGRDPRARGEGRPRSVPPVEPLVPPC